MQLEENEYTYGMRQLQPNDGDDFRDEHLDQLLRMDREPDLVPHTPHMLLAPHELELAGHNSRVIEPMQRLLFHL